MKQAISLGLLLFFLLGGVKTAESVQIKNSDVALQLSIPDSSRLQVLTTTDGSTNVGRIIHIDTDSIDFKTDLSIVRLPISKIASIKGVPVTARKAGKIWFENPNTTRLFFAPTGRMLPKGEGYFSDYYLFFPGFSYGFSDRVTVGGGMSIFPGVSFNEQLFFIAPKVGLVSSESVNLAFGALIMHVPSDDWDGDLRAAGILYGVGTFGSTDASFTVGAGFGFVGGNLEERPMVMVGGEKRLTRTLAFVTENWIFPGIDEPLISYGFRFFGERISVDLGLANVLGEEAIFPGVPYLDFVVRF
jgi:hypothetical protein